MADAPALVYNDAPGAIPASYRLPPGFDMTLHSVSAQFNGGGASGSFYSCLSVYSQDNKLIGRFFPAQVLAAGDSAEVTFAPFLGRGTAEAGGGIQFDTFPQAGNWLYTETGDSTGSPNGYGTEFVDESAGGIHIVERFGNGGAILIENEDDAGLKIVDSNNGGEIEVVSGDVAVRPANNADVELQSGGNFRILDDASALLFSVADDGTIFPAIPPPGIVFDTPNSGGSLEVQTTGDVLFGCDDFSIECAFPNGNTKVTCDLFQVIDASDDTKLIQTAAGVGLSFFGQSPAAQPATPVTLGDVIAALQTLGLVA